MKARKKVDKNQNGCFCLQRHYSEKKAWVSKDRSFGKCFNLMLSFFMPLCVDYQCAGCFYYAHGTDSFKYPDNKYEYHFPSILREKSIHFSSTFSPFIVVLIPNKVLNLRT